MAKQELSSRPAAEQSAEIIATLTAEVESLKKRVTALELADSPTVTQTETVLVAPVKSPQEIRDEIVERAKADVKALIDSDGTVLLPNSIGSKYVCIPEYIVSREKRKVTVVILRGWNSGKVRGVGRAICSANDVFNAYIGRAIALRRALGLEVPAEYLSVPSPTDVRVGDVVYTACDYGNMTVADKTDIRTKRVSAMAYAMLSANTDYGSPRIIDDTREEVAA